jgi:hypothetical protein
MPAIRTSPVLLIGGDQATGHLWHKSTWSLLYKEGTEMLALSLQI